jgi:clorobiocin/coumermycin A biosynthesis protein CloN7/CouN7
VGLIVNSTTRTLDVPGARLSYDVRGSGPLLLMIGSPMGGRGFRAIAPLLAADHTVVTYDPRGILRSSIEDPAQDATPELLADDVHRLLTALGGGPAYVFGNSGGAVTGLDLVARHPDLVRAFVAHEPPLTELLPDGEQLREAIGDICEIYGTVGRDVALKRYTALTGIRFSQSRGDGQQAPPELEEYTPPGDVRAILDRFFRHILRPTTRYRPDLDALRAASTPIVVAGGITSEGQLYHRTTVALAGRLGTPVVGFPGGHTGFQEQPEAFSRLLRRVLTGDETDADVYEMSERPPGSWPGRTA